MQQALMPMCCHRRVVSYIDNARSGGCSSFRPTNSVVALRDLAKQKVSFECPIDLKRHDAWII